MVEISGNYFPIDSKSDDFKITIGSAVVTDYLEISNDFIKFKSPAMAADGTDGQNHDLKIEFNGVFSNIKDFMYTSAGIAVINSISP